MLKTQVQILYFFKHLKEQEDKLYVSIVDTLSFEYKWTVEYIQKLTMTEVVSLLKTIRARKSFEDQILQINVAKGMSGKISANREAQQDKSDIDKLQQLSKDLKIPVRREKK